MNLEASQPTSNTQSTRKGWSVRGVVSDGTRKRRELVVAQLKVLEAELHRRHSRHRCAPAPSRSQPAPKSLRLPRHSYHPPVPLRKALRPEDTFHSLVARLPDLRMVCTLSTVYQDRRSEHRGLARTRFASAGGRPWIWLWFNRRVARMGSAVMKEGTSASLFPSRFTSVKPCSHSQSLSHSPHFATPMATTTATSD
jgi:hypothetical protein